MGRSEPFAPRRPDMTAICTFLPLHRDAGAAPPAAGARQGRSLRQGRQGDTLEAIAPDAAALRSRHSQGGWTAVRLGRYLSITVIAVADVGRAQVLLGVQAV
jgi:hypothetical protein